MHSRSSDSVKNRSSSSWARLPSTNTPDLASDRREHGEQIGVGLANLPAEELHDAEDRRFPAGAESRTRREIRPARRTARGGSSRRATTSGIQVGSRPSQTRPGRPTPGRNVVRRVTASNSSTCSDGACQVATDRRHVAARSMSQRAPYSQSSASQIARAFAARRRRGSPIRPARRPSRRPPVSAGGAYAPAPDSRATYPWASPGFNPARVDRRQYYTTPHAVIHGRRGRPKSTTTVSLEHIAMTSPAARKRILLVDDDRAFRHAIGDLARRRRLLGSSGRRRTRGARALDPGAVRPDAPRHRSARA